MNLGQIYWLHFALIFDPFIYFVIMSEIYIYIYIWCNFKQYYSI